MDESVRLARMEAKLDSLKDGLEEQIRRQDKINDLFFATRDKVNDMDSRQRGAWFVVTIISGIVSALSATLVSIFKG